MHWLPELLKMIFSFPNKWLSISQTALFLMIRLLCWVAFFVVLLTSCFLAFIMKNKKTFHTYYCSALRRLRFHDLKISQSVFCKSLSKKSATFLNVTDFICLNINCLLLPTFLNSFAFQPLPSFPAFCVENDSSFWVWFYFPESEREFSVRQ